MKFIDYFYRFVCRKTQFVDHIFADGSCGKLQRSKYLKFDLGKRVLVIVCVLVVPVAVLVIFP